MATLTRAQRSWLAELSELVGSTAEVAADEERDDGRGTVVKRPPAASKLRLAALSDDPVASDQGQDRVRQSEQLFGLGPEDLVGPVIQKLAGPLSATCIVHNNTQQTLRVDFASFDEHEDQSGKRMGISSGEYEDAPPETIQPGDQNSRFKGVNVELALGVRLKGVEGFVRYFIDEQKTAWVLHFNNPRSGDNTATKTRLEGPNAAKFEIPKVAIGGGKDAKFLYVLNAKGGTTPPVPPPPNPQPVPVDTIASSCLIQIQNKTTQKLNLKAAKHERGDFMVRPKVTIDPDGVDDAIVSIETPRAPDEGCKGFIEYAIGEPPIATWRVEWDNPEGQKNTADAPISPATPTLDAVALISQGDENVRVNFLLRETGGGGDPTPPPPETPFVPPVESKQPTLRKGDSSADGWVEFAQKLLNEAVNAGLQVNGNFDGAMLAAVKKFQASQKPPLLVDGVIGNQTWAALRHATPEKPSTDGRKPHEFVEKGVEARWVFEDTDNNRYFADTDFFRLLVESVGDTPLDPKTEATIRVTAPGAAPKLVKAKLLPRDAGSTHRVEVKNFRKIFPSNPKDAPVTQYRVEAFLPQDLGGDNYTANVKEGSGSGAG